LEYTIGSRQYELSNHLGNVLAVISDWKIPVISGASVLSYNTVVVSSQDYSPFGVTLSGRSWSAGYRYGFQNQETDNEMWGGAISFKYRVEDARLGRFFSVDDLVSEYPWNSPFAFSENEVIAFEELEGREKKPNRGGAYPCPVIEDKIKTNKFHEKKTMITVVETVYANQPNIKTVNINSRVNKNLRIHLKARFGVQVTFRSFQVPDRLIVSRDEQPKFDSGLVATDPNNDGVDENPVNPIIPGSGEFEVTVIAGPLPPGYETTQYGITVTSMEQKVVTVKKYLIWGIIPIKINRKVEYRNLNTQSQLPEGIVKEKISKEENNEVNRISRRKQGKMWRKVTKKNRL